MSEFGIQNTALIEDWSTTNGIDYVRIRGKIRHHMTEYGPGKWSEGPDHPELHFGIRAKLTGDPGRYAKGDIVKTNSSILILGNPKVE
jgi:hypothetical protein